MPLMPKRTKYRKMQKGRNRGKATRGNVVNEGEFGLQTLEAGLITSKVKVELDVRTKEESVDIEAESTSTITTAIITGANVESIAGTIVSKRGFPLAE